MAYFEPNSKAMLDLESMVDAVGIRNVLYALSHICSEKAEHVATNWQDAATAKIWDRWSARLELSAAGRPHLIDPLTPVK